jgi:putative ABC transport system permease protein
MLKNYLFTAVRNLFRHKAYTLFNVAGLALGLGVVIMILLFLNHELTYDHFFKDKDKICRVITEIQTPNKTIKGPKVIYDIDQKIPEQLPEVSESTVMFRQYYNYFKKDKKEFGKYIYSYVDEDFFDVFSFDVIKGDPKLLSEPNTIVLTKQAANEVFNTKDPINQTIQIREKDFRVVGIMENVPVKSHLDFHALASINTLGKENIQSHGHDFYTYFLLNQPVTNDLGEKICRHTEAIEKERYNQSSIQITNSLQPLKRIHLFSDYSSDLAKVTPVKYIYIFSLIALIILIIASFNFINISIARANTRKKEVGIRKVNGASLGSLRKQFLGESVLITFISFLFAIIIVELFIDDFAGLIGSDLDKSFQLNLWWIPAGLLLSLLVGIIAGIYPAFYLSEISSVRTLKGHTENKKHNPGLQKVLITIQFFISIALIASLTGVLVQNNYLKQKDLGFQKKNILVANYLTSKIKQKYEPIRQELLKNPAISDVTASLAIPGTKGSGTNLRAAGQTEKESLQIRANIIKKNFPSFYGIDITKGKPFTEGFGAGNNHILINEKVAELLNMANPVGKEVYMWGSKKYISGVFKNYHNRSLHKKIDPVVLHQNMEKKGPNRYMNHFSVKISGAEIDQTVDYVHKVMKRYDPDYTFQYAFLENYLQERYYQNEAKYAKLIMTSSVMAILISIMGLFALTAFHINQKTKEIGTRKVFGASPAKIIWLYSKKYLFWVLLAALFALPLAHVFVKNWYNGFVYHANIQWWFYGLSMFITIIIAFGTVFGKTYKAANTNPAHTLRDE